MNEFRGKVLQGLAPVLAQDPGARIGRMVQPNRYAGLGPGNLVAASVPGNQMMLRASPSARSVRSLPLSSRSRSARGSSRKGSPLLLLNQGKSD
jgi:hypothetical protein